jgi:hypothetical protein
MLIDAPVKIQTPQRVELRLREGAVDLGSSTEQRIGPVRNRSSQPWFWEPGWLAGETEATLDIRDGRTQVFESADDFLASLDD